MRLSEGLQKFISFGYLYLIVMGILQESTFYYQLGINILNYSTITDILLGPIATLTARPIVLLATIIISILSYTIPLYLSRNRHKNWIQKSFLKNKENLGEEEVGKHFTNLFVSFLALGLLNFFLGLGIGAGIGLSHKIVSNKLEHKDKVNFNDGQTENIYLVGTNSLYFFYLSKGNQNVKISPIGTIKNLELFDKKKIK